MKKIKTFVAVDFETMTTEPTSICAAGIVKVTNGVITEQHYTLVKPVADNCTNTFAWLHGITREMTASAHEYPLIHAIIGNLLEDGSPLVCHNAAADIRFIDACAEYYQLEELGCDVYDTYQLSGSNLADACEQHNISLNDHHNALCDACACAKLFLALQGLPTEPPKPKRSNKFEEMSAVRHIDRHTLSIPTDDEISDNSTIFYRSNCVITGTFAAYPKREDLAATLRSLGADINTAISGKTTLVVAGKGFGPKKMADIEKRQAAGQAITLIGEEELLKILETINR